MVTKDGSIRKGLLLMEVIESDAEYEQLENLTLNRLRVPKEKVSRKFQTF